MMRLWPDDREGQAILLSTPLALSGIFVGYTLSIMVGSFLLIIACVLVGYAIGYIDGRRA